MAANTSYVFPFVTENMHVKIIMSARVKIMFKILFFQPHS